MANTGYTINPNLIQYFTDGPLSGTIVNSSYNVDLTIIPETIICGVTYSYREYTPSICAGNICISPDIISTNVGNCDIYDYTYNVDYSANVDVTANPYTVIEYSLQSDFSIESGSKIATPLDNNGYILVDISDLTVLPLNGYTEVYFRAYNSCSLPTPTYSNIYSSSCALN